LGALSVNVTVPPRGPAVVGLKVTLMVQLAPTAREAPQLFVCAKLALATIDAMFSSAAPVFVNVTGCGALVENEVALAGDPVLRDIEVDMDAALLRPPRAAAAE